VFQEDSRTWSINRLLIVLLRNRLATTFSSPSFSILLTLIFFTDQGDDEITWKVSNGVWMTVFFLVPSSTIATTTIGDRFAHWVEAQLRESSCKILVLFYIVILLLSVRLWHTLSSIYLFGPFFQRSLSCPSMSHLVSNHSAFRLEYQPSKLWCWRHECPNTFGQSSIFDK